MLQNLTAVGINIPYGFVITLVAYRKFYKIITLRILLKTLLMKLIMIIQNLLKRGGLQTRQLIKNSRFPKDLSALIIEAYQELSKSYDQDLTDVPVRSSATAEDLPDASFAG